MLASSALSGGSARAVAFIAQMQGSRLVSGFLWVYLSKLR
jgi:hypothetical protein